MSNRVNTGVPGYTPQMLEGMGYDPSIDYNEELNRYNDCAARKDIHAATDLLRRHGGMISFVMKCDYQRKLNAK